MIRSTRTRRLVVGASTLVAVALLATGSATAAGRSTARLSITKVTPTTVRVGQTIAVVGTGFKSATRVTIDRTVARFSVASQSRLNVTVPSGASDGTLVVAAGRETADGPRIALVPSITSFSPTSGGVGTKVTVVGSGFSTTGSCSLAFNGTASPCTVSSSTKLTSTVPPLSTSGKLKVTIGGTSSGVTSSSFTITLGVALSVSTGPPTTSLSVYGSGFGANEAVDVYLGTTDEALVVTNAKGAFDYAGFQVAPGTQPGEAWISAVGRTTGRAAQTLFDVNTNWAQYSFGDTGNRDNPFEDTITPSNVASLRKVWEVDSTGTGTSDVVELGGVVYVADSCDKLLALNELTGSKQWSYTAPSCIQGIAGSTSAIYFVDAAGAVGSVNRQTGLLSWSSTLPPEDGGNDVAQGTPAVSGNAVVVASEIEPSFDCVACFILSGLNAVTGHLLWSEPGYPAGGWSQPVAAEGLVYSGSSPFIGATNAQTGSGGWGTLSFATYALSMSVQGGTAYVTGEDPAAVAAFNAATGSENWTTTLPDAPGCVGPAGDGAVLYVSCENGVLYELSTTNGSIIRSTSFTYGPSAAADSVTTAVSVADGVVYVGTASGELYALDQSGDVLWSYDTSGGIGNPGDFGQAAILGPIVVNGELIAGLGGPNIYAFALPNATTDAELMRADRPALGILRPDRSLVARS